MPGRRRPTLRDVAREAELSVTQASRALNGHSDVASATRRRAMAAAARLGYTPNLEARRLKVPGTGANSIGMVIAERGPRFSDPFFGDLLSAIVDEAERHGFGLQLSTAPTGEDPTSAYERALRHGRVDGFVVTRLRIDDDRVRYLHANDVPFVTFGRLPNDDGFPFVDEHDEALRPAVDLLVDLGHRRIACITEPGHFAKAVCRRRSFDAAMAARSIPVAEEQVVEGGFREESGYDAAMELLTRPDRPTAIVAFNDLLAIGALRAARELGVEVPTRLSVIGFDDIDAARLVTPALTTLRQPTADVGRLLVRRLLTALGRSTGHGADDSPLVSPQLVVRRSTGAPPT